MRRPAKQKDERRTAQAMSAAGPAEVSTAGLQGVAPRFSSGLRPAPELDHNYMIVLRQELQLRADGLRDHRADDLLADRLGAAWHGSHQDRPAREYPNERHPHGAPPLER
ncbi:hypothetical protein GCM10022255_091150 [Dactylosporangium darangshiense]|uniref:Uncharacterized protein n=1 Tax=Dactylosporangium darangshiense TaxID=579108 RepID=A0ABP8DPR8_9ACTN